MAYYKKVKWIYDKESDCDLVNVYVHMCYRTDHLEAVLNNDNKVEPQYLFLIL